MKKLLLSTTLLAGLFGMQAHADYVAPSPSIASQAAQYSIMAKLKLARLSPRLAAFSKY